jgi:hypothetical protein
MFRDALPDNGWDARSNQSETPPVAPRRKFLARLLREPLTHFVAIGSPHRNRYSRINQTQLNAKDPAIHNFLRLIGSLRPAP